MQLPDIALPKFDLPFDISLLMHSPIVHFAMVIPVIVLLLEFYNLFVRRKSIGVFSFMLIVLTVIVFAGAYITGGIDGKEAYDLLSPDGQAELKEHKLLGTYLLLISTLILVLKLLAMTGKTFLKALFFIVLTGFVILTFKQGKDGGELVYEYGANIEHTKVLDEQLSDLKEELEEAEETISTMKANNEMKAKSVQVEATQKPKATVEKILEEAPTPQEPIKQDVNVQKALQGAAEDVSTKVEEEKLPALPKIETNTTVQ